MLCWFGEGWCGWFVWFWGLFSIWLVFIGAFHKASLITYNIPHHERIRIKASFQIGIWMLFSLVLNSSPFSAFSRSKHTDNYLALSVMLKRSVVMWPTVLVPLAAILLKVVASHILEKTQLYMSEIAVFR